MPVSAATQIGRGIVLGRRIARALLLNPIAGRSDLMAKPYGEVLDEMDHQAKYQPATISARREQELRIQALGAAISRRDWNATERAYDAIRDKFYEVAHPLI